MNIFVNCPHQSFSSCVQQNKVSILFSVLWKWENGILEEIADGKINATTSSEESKYPKRPRKSIPVKRSVNVTCKFFKESRCWNFHRMSDFSFLLEFDPAQSQKFAICRNVAAR